MKLDVLTPFFNVTAGGAVTPAVPANVVRDSEGKAVQDSEGNYVTIDVTE